MPRVATVVGVWFVRITELFGTVIISDPDIVSTLLIFTWDHRFCEKTEQCLSVHRNFLLYSFILKKSSQNICSQSSMLVKSVDQVSWTHILPRDLQLSKLDLENFVGVVLFCSVLFFSGLVWLVWGFFPSLIKIWLLYWL